jgi:hypothetical protein
MDWLNRVVTGLLRCSEPLLSAERRAWARALQAEANQVPEGWDRLAWLAGGVRFTLRETVLNRGLGYALVFAAAVAGTAWSAWSGPPGDSAIVINRIDVIAISVILAGLPWAVRRARGPMAGGRQARMIRTAGYAAILVLVLVKAAVERVADAPPNNLEAAARAWTGEIAFLAVMACYAAVILACTARRSLAAPATVAVGTGTGAAIGILIYVLGPLGFPLRFTGLWPVSWPLRCDDGSGCTADAVCSRRCRTSCKPTGWWLNVHWFWRPTRCYGRTVHRGGRRTGSRRCVYFHHCAAALRHWVAELGRRSYRPVDADGRTVVISR